jgi:hypothetical protein
MLHYRLGNRKTSLLLILTAKIDSHLYHVRASTRLYDPLQLFRNWRIFMNILTSTIPLKATPSSYLYFSITSITNVEICKLLRWNWLWRHMIKYKVLTCYVITDRRTVLEKHTSFIKADNFLCRQLLRTRQRSRIYTLSIGYLEPEDKVCGLLCSDTA